MRGSERYDVVRAAPEELIPLRRRVLRGNDPQATASDPRDHDDTALHLAVRDRGVVVGCGSFYPTPSPVNPAAHASQLRYLATEPALQGTGVGTILLRAAESELTAHGYTQLWANGRDTALGFYDARGWDRVAGSAHLSSETGLPHTVIVRELVDARSVNVDWARDTDAAACAALREEMYFALRWREFGDEWVTASAAHFARGIAQETLIASVARTDDGEVVALAAAALRDAPPLPRNPHGRVGYLHSVSVRPRFRHRGLARLVVAAVVDELDRREYERVELHATDYGKQIYVELGFEERTHSPEMRKPLRDISFDEA